MPVNYIQPHDEIQNKGKRSDFCLFFAIFNVIIQTLLDC